MRTPRVIAILVVSLVLVGGCGARLPASVRQQAKNADLNGRSVASGTTTVASGAPTTAVASANHVRPNTTCPTSGTDVGLTSTTLNLGTIADVTGPVPGLFTGAQQGINAWAAYVNATGGLCGHQVKIDFGDGQTSCSANTAAQQGMVDKDFAMVGTFSLYDGCGATVLKKTPTMPDIHVDLDPAAGDLANNFDFEGGAPGYATGMFKYYAKLLGNKVQDVGTFDTNVPSAEEKQGTQVKAAESVGWKFTFQDTVSSTAGDFTGEFQKMCGEKHVKAFYLISETAQNSATALHDESQVSACKGVVNIIPVAYDQSFLTYCKQVNCGSALDTLQGWNEYALFFNANEAANIPELKLFDTWFAKTNPGKPSDLYALFAWADGRMFQQAFESAGPVANRQTVLAALNKLKNFSDNGVVAPSDPSTKTNGVTCYVPWTLHNGVFSRQGVGKSGYRCDGTYLRS